MAKLAQIKTKETQASVEDFLEDIVDEQKRKDSFLLVKMMGKVTGEKPKMWGASMIGFGNHVYTSPATGRQVEWFKIGFAPRKANLSLHLIRLDEDLLDSLGKYKAGKGCLYINKLEDVDLLQLEKIMKKTLEESSK